MIPVANLGDIQRLGISSHTSDIPTDEFLVSLWCRFHQIPHQRPSFLGLHCFEILNLVAAQIRLMHLSMDIELFPVPEESKVRIPAKPVSNRSLDPCGKELAQLTVHRE
jgi:hypothetical protein